LGLVELNAKSENSSQELLPKWVGPYCDLAGYTNLIAIIFELKYMSAFSDVLTANKKPDSGYRDALEVLQTAVENEPYYAWLKAFNRPLEARIGAVLKSSHRPDRTLFDPCLFEEHFAKGDQLLQQCLARTQQINEIESQAVLSALSYLNDQGSENDEFELAKLQIRSYLHQLGKPLDSQDSFLTSRLSHRTGLRLLRMAMHSSPGHPLNYVERAQILESLQADELRSVSERFHAARLGMMLVSGNDLPEVPEWDEYGVQNLQALLSWSERVVRMFEVKGREERIVLRTVRIFRDSLGTANRSFAQIVADHGDIEGPISIPFTFDLKRLALKNEEVPRLLSFGVAIELDEETSILDQRKMFKLIGGGTADEQSKFSQREAYLRALRDKFTFSATLEVPEQKVGEVAWKRPQIQLGNEVRVWQTVLNEAPALFRMPQIKNSNPVGQWEILLDPYFQMTSKRDRLRTLLQSNLPSTESLLALRDVVVWLRLAVRAMQ
jgi:hypothetical protein